MRDDSHHSMALNTLAEVVKLLKILQAVDPKLYIVVIMHPSSCGQLQERLSSPLR
jgi:hypothetical protein